MSSAGSEAARAPLEGGPEERRAPRRAGRSPLPRPEAEAVRHIPLDYGDTYDGEARLEGGVAVPHGHGTLRSSAGRHCYVGHFAHRWRDGYGRLATERYVLWAKWRTNRPDLTNSARVDYPSGDKYCGFLRLSQDSRFATLLHTRNAEPLSKFSVWAQTTAPVRERWGELVLASGDRYFGEWDADQPSGFGCYVTRRGDRYVGRLRGGKFHLTGTLFMRGRGPLLDGVRLQPRAPRPDGGCERGGGGGGGSGSGCNGRGGAACVVLDGVWSDGRFSGDGHATLPCGARVTAGWRGAARPYEGEAVFPRAVTGGGGGGGEAPLWRECFQWEPLLCGARDDARRLAAERCAAFRAELQRAATTEVAHRSLINFLATDPAVRNALNIFRRCFFFLYGSCGAAGEIGAGGGANRLGWCYLRNAFGGCIHPPRGRPVEAYDLELARLDILSFVRSVQRWALEMAGEENAAHVQRGGGELLVGRWVADRVLQDVHDVLLNLYRQVFAAEGAALAQALDSLRGRIALDDLGVVFGRQQREERLFDPYADAIHCIEKLNEKEHTLSAKLGVLLQWSKEIHLSTRLAQVDRGRVLLGKVESCTVQAGSADDLIPIHQYVLSQARVDALFAHCQLLVDFSAEPTFVDPTSQECFCATTLQACVMTLPLLHPFVRDGSATLIPTSVVEEGVAAAVERVEQRAGSFVEALGAAPPSGCSAGHLARAARGYARAWLPALLARQRQRGHCGPQPQSQPLCSVLPPVLLPLVALPGCPSAARLFCWSFARRLLSLAGAALDVVGPDGARLSFSPADVERDVALVDSWPVTSDSVVVVWWRPALPTCLCRLEDLLTRLL